MYQTFALPLLLHDCRPVAVPLRFFSKTQDVREPFASSSENKKLPCDIKDGRNDDININLEAFWRALCCAARPGKGSVQDLPCDCGGRDMAAHAAPPVWLCGVA